MLLLQLICFSSVMRETSCCFFQMNQSGVYISQLIRFARVSSSVDDFNTRNKVLIAKLLRQGYRYHKLRKAFSKL